MASGEEFTLAESLETKKAVWNITLPADFPTPVPDKLAAQPSNEFLLYVILCICAIIFVIVSILLICFCYHRRPQGASEIHQKPTSQETRATSVSGLDCANTNSGLEPSSLPSARYGQEFGDTMHTSLPAKKECFVDTMQLDSSGGSVKIVERHGDNNEAAGLLTHGSMWSESPVSRVDTYSIPSNSYNNRDNYSSGSSEVGATGGVTFPTDANGHPRAWFVPLNEMCEESGVRHSGIMMPGDLRFTAIPSTKKTLKKSESSHAKLQTSHYSSEKLSKWALREGRPVVVVPDSNDKL